MMRIFNRLWAAVSVLMLLGFSTVWSAPEGKASSAEFTCVIWESLNLGDVFYLENERYMPLEFRRGARSALYPISDSQALRLFIQKEVEGEVVYNLIGQAKVPRGSKRMLFLIRKNEGQQGLPLKILGLDDSLKPFPPGAYKFVNFTDATLDVKIHETRRKIEPKAMKVVRPEIPDKGGFLPFYIGDRERNAMLYETRLYSQRTSRKIVFIFPAEGKRPISVKFLSQLVSRSELAASQENGVK